MLKPVSNSMMGSPERRGLSIKYQVSRFMPPPPFLRLLSVVVFLMFFGVRAFAMPSPQIRVLRPPELERIAIQVEHLAQEDFTEVLNLTGRLGFTSEITVVLMPEGSPLAEEAPRWVAGVRTR